jgi:predicted kinase
MEAVIFVGIQAVGKSTFYRERFEDTHIRLNLDMLKTRRRERILLEACLAAKQPFVVDNTNVTCVDRTRYIAPARAAGFRVVGYYFRSSMRDAVERNSLRPGRKAVPEKGIAGTRRRLELPSLAEGFDQLYYVSIGEAGGFAVEEWVDGL